MKVHWTAAKDQRHLCFQHCKVSTTSWRWTAHDSGAQLIIWPVGCKPHVLERGGCNIYCYTDSIISYYVYYIYICKYLCSFHTCVYISICFLGYMHHFLSIWTIPKNIYKTSVIIPVPETLVAGWCGHILTSQPSHHQVALQARLRWSSWWCWWRHMPKDNSLCIAANARKQKVEIPWGCFLAWLFKGQSRYRVHEGWKKSHPSCCRNWTTASNSVV